jgi:hypothetical protein
MADVRAQLDVRAEIARTLRPVTPLAPPGRRALVFLVLGAAWLILVSIWWGIRRDAPALGISRLWALSALQVAAAGLMFRHALAESIPGRLNARWRVALWAALGTALMLGVTALTFLASPTYVPHLREARYLYTCATRTFALGIPALAIAGWLLRRGLTMRPIIAGALAGLGAGLLADSSWRIYCEVSDPHHVLTAHAAGIVALAAAGGLAGLVVQLLARLIARRG